MPHQADSRNLPVTSGPGTGARVVRVRDVVVVPWVKDDATREEFDAHPPATNSDLGHGLSLVRLPQAEAELLMNASSHRGHFFIPVRQFSQRYSFVREVALDVYETQPYAWNTDGRVGIAIALSRLIRDNAHCPEFAGRLIDYEDGEQQVVPLNAYEFRLAYRYKQDRGWLDAAEAAELAALVDAYLAVEPEWPTRLRRAINACDRASQLPYLSESQPRLVTGLESLLNTDNSQTTKQFRERVYALAQDLGIEGLSKNLLGRMYEARSQAYHGSEVRLFSGDPEAPRGEVSPSQQRAIDETILLQEVLRAAVRKAIDDGDFRALFEDDAAIRDRWPVRVRQGWRRVSI